MKETGRVVTVSGTRARIEVTPHKACRTCPACTVCQPQGKARYIEVDNSIGARVGDDVCIETSTGQSVVATVLVFGMPVALALVGLIIGTSLGDVLSMILGAAGFIAGLAVAKIFNTIFTRRRLLPRIIAINCPPKDLTL